MGKKLLKCQKGCSVVELLQKWFQLLLWPNKLSFKKQGLPAKHINHN